MFVIISSIPSRNLFEIISICFVSLFSFSVFTLSSFTSCSLFSAEFSSAFVSVELLIESYFGKELAKHLIELETKTNPDYVNFNGVESLKSSGAKALLIYSDNDHLCYKNASYDILYEAFKDDSNVKLILENGKWHNPNYTMDAVEYYLSFATLKAELLSKNLLLTKEQKEAFKASFDWNRMTAQDEKIWNEIINWLK